MTEATEARRFVEIILGKGYDITHLYTGDGMVTHRSRDADAICANLGDTEADTLVIRVPGEADRAGVFWLIWGNAEDGSELVADYTCNDACNAIWNELHPELAD